MIFPLQVRNGLSLQNLWATKGQDLMACLDRSVESTASGYIIHTHPRGAVL